VWAYWLLRILILKIHFIEQKNELTCFAKWPIPITQLQSERTGVATYTDSGQCVGAGQGR